MSESVRGETRDLLKWMGATTGSAAGGPRHRGVFVAVALVLLDLIMPGMGGRDAYAEIVKRRPGQPVLFTSGYSEHRQQVGTAEVLAKPFRPSQLLRSVRTAIDQAPVC